MSVEEMFKEISVNEVHDLAYDIAQEFEKLVSHCDLEEVKCLIHKVINILETLEKNIKRTELLDSELSDSRSTVLHLSSEKISYQREISKLKKVFEEAEESWLVEIENLRSHICLLKNENESLKSDLAIKDKTVKPEEPSNELFNDKSSEIEKLKYSLKQKDRELYEDACSINALNSKIQELLEMNKLLHLKQQDAKKTIDKLWLEKMECRSKLVVQKRENVLLKDTISEFVQNTLNDEKVCYQHSANVNMPTDSFDKDYVPCKSPSCNKKERALLLKINQLQSELNIVKLKYEQDPEKLKNYEKELPFKKPIIQQFFHLFLGPVAISNVG